MNLLKTIPLLFLSALLITACTPGAPQDSPANELPPSITETPTQDWSQVPSYRVQLTITTSSNWTANRLLEGSGP